MRVRIVGCSPACPNPGGAQSGYLVDDRLLLDCGAGVVARLRAEERWQTVQAIVLTHLHLDHWGDLVPWAWGRLVYGYDRVSPPALWLPPGGSAELEAFAERFGAAGMFDDAFDVHEYAEGTPFEAARLRLTAIRLPHFTLGSFGLRVTDGERVLAYSGDTGASQRLVELARDAHVFLCEAGADERDSGGHLTPEEAIEAFEASGAERLLLTHRLDELPVPPLVERVYDGLEISV